ncbi:methyltransferase domain-containing protein [Streptomyces sp. NPDC005969]|uniref:methyltransferase domain-containing protein n=1 Tax=Streptomyces sp. NPDC005969 TaxID=3156722 RepID=UPI0033ED7E44
MNRKTYPDLRFDVGSMNALDLDDGSLGGIVAWYSIIHTPPELLPEVFAEFHRVLAPGGHLLLAFKAGNEIRHLDHAYGHALALDVYWLEPERVAELLSRAGLLVDARLVREAGWKDAPRHSSWSANRRIRSRCPVSSPCPTGAMGTGSPSRARRRISAAHDCRPAAVNAGRTMWRSTAAAARRGGSRPSCGCPRWAGR